VSKVRSRILVVKLGAIGDLLYALPSVEETKRRYPELEIDWMVGTGLAPLLEGNPNISEVIKIEESLFELKRHPLHIYQLYLHIRARLRRSYTHVIVLSRSRGFAYFLALITGQRVFRLSRTQSDRKVALAPPLSMHESAAFRKVFELAWQSYELRAGGHSLSNRTKVHDERIKRSLISVSKILEETGRENEAKPFTTGGEPKHRIKTTAELQSWLVKADLSYIKESVAVDDPYIAVHLGGGLNSKTEFRLKRWPYMRELVAQLLQSYPQRVVLIGSRAEAEEASDLLNGLSETQKLRISNYVGKTTLRELVGLIRGAHLVLGPDSGPIHISDAMGVPTLGIYGPTSELSWGVLSSSSKTVSYKVPCQPCYKDNGVFPPCSNQHACMTGLSVETLMATVQDLLNPLR